MSTPHIPGRGFVALVHKEWRDTRGLFLVLACAGPLLLDFTQRFFREEIEIGQAVPLLWFSLVALSSFVLISECFARDERTEVGRAFQPLPVQRVKLLAAKSSYIVVATACLTAWFVAFELSRSVLGGPVVDAQWSEVASPAAFRYMLAGLGFSILCTLVFRQSVVCLVASGLFLYVATEADHALDAQRVYGLVPYYAGMIPTGWIAVSTVVLLGAASICVYRPGSPGRKMLHRGVIASSVLIGPIVPAVGWVAMIDSPHVGEVGCWIPSPSGRFVTFYHQERSVPLITLDPEFQYSMEWGVLDTATGEIVRISEDVGTLALAGAVAWADDTHLILGNKQFKSEPSQSGRFIFDVESSNIVRHIDCAEWDEWKRRSRGQNWGSVRRVGRHHDREGSVWIREETASDLNPDERWLVLANSDVHARPCQKRGDVIVLDGETLERRNLLAKEVIWSVHSGGAYYYRGDSPDGRWALSQRHDSAVRILDAWSGETKIDLIGSVTWSTVPGRVLEGFYWDPNQELHVPGVRDQRRHYWVSDDWEKHEFDPPGYPAVWLDGNRLIFYEYGGGRPTNADTSALYLWDRRTDDVTLLIDMKEESQ
tara:strand:+ start:919 stop:2709 length:1791 start_codon:yes stop_codon:yes gene_type:complete